MEYSARASPSPTHMQLVNYLGTEYEPAYLRNWMRSYRLDPSGLTDADVRSHVARRLEHGGWTAEKFRARSGRSISPLRHHTNYTHTTSPRIQANYARGGYTSPSKYAGAMSPTRQMGTTSPSRYAGTISPTRYTQGSRPTGTLSPLKR